MRGEKKTVSLPQRACSRLSEAFYAGVFDGLRLTLGDDEFI
jgi:hypothetical protein